MLDAEPVANGRKESIGCGDKYDPEFEAETKATTKSVILMFLPASGRASSGHSSCVVKVIRLCRDCFVNGYPLLSNFHCLGNFFQVAAFSVILKCEIQQNHGNPDRYNDNKGDIFGR